jgi:tetratricopeptide (TPR) repeat protein
MPCESEHPAKRAKISSVATVSINQFGISNMLVERTDNEQRPYAQLRIDEGNLVLQTEMDTRNDIIPSITARTETHSPQIHKPQHYDEGMCLYTDALPLSDTMNGPIRAAIILYNMAQNQCKKGDYVDAIYWFGLAMVRIRLDPVNPSAAMIEMQVHHNLGNCHYRLGKNGEAMLSYKRALLMSQEARLGKLHVATAQHAMAVLHFHSDPSQTNKTITILQNCLSVYQEVLGAKSKETATILNNIARVHYLRGDCMQALATFEECLSIRLQNLGYDSIDVAATICNIGQTHHRIGSLNVAMQHYLEFLTMAEVHLGRDHGDVAVIRKYMAEILHDKGELPWAKRLYEQALERGRVVFGKYHPEIASILNKLGNLHYEMQDLETALLYFTEGLKIERAVFHPCHPFIMVTLMNMAQLHKYRGCFATALHTYSQLHTMQLQAYGPGSLEVAKTLTYMGLLQFQRKEYPSALEFYEEALRIQLERVADNGDADIASTLNSMGLVLFHQRLYDLAQSCFEDSLRMKLKILGPNHSEVAILWYNIATVNLEKGKDDTAIKLYKEALRIEREAHGKEHHGVVLTLQHLGMVFQGRGELNEALNYFTQALDIEEARQDINNVPLVAKLMNLIGNIHLQKANVAKMMECYTEASRLYFACAAESDVLIISGYNFYGLSRLHPPCAPVA